MSKRTPGNWHFKEVPSGEFTTDLVISNGDERVCYLTESRYREADARLIAAAPELLQAAKWAVGFVVNEMLKLEQMKLNKPDIGTVDPRYIDILISQYDRIRKECQDAIDKAEGKGVGRED